MATVATPIVKRRDWRTIVFVIVTGLLAVLVVVTALPSVLDPWFHTEAAEPGFTPELHRWHHSRSREEADHNYGDNFIFWDIVFGTYYRPRDREVEALGIAGLGAFPKSFLAQLAAPLRWRSIEAASRAHAPVSCSS